MYKIPVPNVRFGSGVPVVEDTDKENDTYIRTDDGLHTGVFQEMYKFDNNYNVWILCTLPSTTTTNTYITGAGYTIVNINSTPYNVTYTSDKYIFIIDASSGIITLNLPTAVSNTAEFVFKKIDSTLNSVIIEGLGAETIDTELNKTILFQNTSFSICSDNANWQRLT